MSARMLYDTYSAFIPIGFVAVISCVCKRECECVCGRAVYVYAVARALSRGASEYFKDEVYRCNHDVKFIRLR